MNRNPTRGCGKKKKGGFYLEAEKSPFGTLAIWSWVLGTHILDGRLWRNLLTQAAQRSMTLIDPAATLVTGEVHLAGMPFEPKEVPENQLHDLLDHNVHLNFFETTLNRVGEYGILDYVGSNNYTPWSFYQETMKYGPSRKVSPDFAREIAPHLPLPVFFCMDGLPFFPTDKYLLEAWLDSIDTTLTHEEKVIMPTWWDENWGLTSGKYNGSGHPIVDILGYYDEMMPPNSMPGEAIMGATWFTQATYCLKDADDPGVDWLNVENLDLDALEEEE